jgi:hypothetical protein
MSDFEYEANEVIVAAQGQRAAEPASISRSAPG